MGLEVRRLDENNIGAELAVSSLSAVGLGGKGVGGSVLVVEGLELREIQRESRYIIALHYVGTPISPCVYKFKVYPSLFSLSLP